MIWTTRRRLHNARERPLVRVRRTAVGSPRCRHTRATRADWELIGLYSGMCTSRREIFAGCAESALELRADFLRRTAHAGRSATDELAGD